MASFGGVQTERQESEAYKAQQVNLGAGSYQGGFANAPQQIENEPNYLANALFDVADKALQVQAKKERTKKYLEGRKEIQQGNTVAQMREDDSLFNKLFMENSATLEGAIAQEVDNMVSSTYLEQLQSVDKHKKVSPEEYKKLITEQESKLLTGDDYRDLAMMNKWGAKSESLINAHTKAHYEHMTELKVTGTIQAIDLETQNNTVLKNSKHSDEKAIADSDARIKGLHSNMLNYGENHYASSILLGLERFDPSGYAVWKKAQQEGELLVSPSTALRIENGFKGFQKSMTKNVGDISDLKAMELFKLNNGIKDGSINSVEQAFALRDSFKEKYGKGLGGLGATLVLMQTHFTANASAKAKLNGINQGLRNAPFIDTGTEESSLVIEKLHKLGQESSSYSNVVALTPPSKEVSNIFTNALSLTNVDKDGQISERTVQTLSPMVSAYINNKNRPDIKQNLSSYFKSDKSKAMWFHITKGLDSGKDVVTSMSEAARLVEMAKKAPPTSPLIKALTNNKDFNDNLISKLGELGINSNTAGGFIARQQVIDVIEKANLDPETKAILQNKEPDELIDFALTVSGMQEVESHFGVDKNTWSNEVKKASPRLVEFTPKERVEWVTNSTEYDVDKKAYLKLIGNPAKEDGESLSYEEAVKLYPKDNLQIMYNKDRKSMFIYVVDDEGVGFKPLSEKPIDDFISITSDTTKAIEISNDKYQEHLQKTKDFTQAQVEQEFDSVFETTYKRHKGTVYIHRETGKPVDIKKEDVLDNPSLLDKFLD